MNEAHGTLEDRQHPGDQTDSTAFVFNAAAATEHDEPRTAVMIVSPLLAALTIATATHVSSINWLLPGCAIGTLLAIVAYRIVVRSRTGSRRLARDARLAATQLVEAATWILVTTWLAQKMSVTAASLIAASSVALAFLTITASPAGNPRIQALGVLAFLSVPAISAYLRDDVTGPWTGILMATLAGIVFASKQSRAPASPRQAPVSPDAVDTKIDRLQRKLARRTAEVAHATTEKTQFVANASHELRTPLHGILGSAELLLASEISDRHRRLVDAIHESGKSLLKLVNDILDLSQAESGRLQLHRDTVPIRSLLDTIALIMKNLAAAKGLGLIVDIDPDVPDDLSLDGERFKQILLNLGGNAIKFTNRGSVRVRVEYDRPTGRMTTFVADCGPGIPIDRRQSIFDSFVRLGRGDFETGTGLGLAIARRLVDAMGGEMDLASMAGIGSTFWFSFPAPIARELEEPPARMVSGRITRARPGDAGKILIVDDNGPNRRLAREQVEYLGHDATIAEDAFEALSIMMTREFDLVLMDCQMPGMSGHEAVMRIRKMRGRNRLVPVVAVSANAFPEEQQKAIKAGMDDYITKPLTLRELKQTIQNWVVDPANYQLPECAEFKPLQDDSDSAPGALLAENRVNELVRLVEAAGFAAFEPILEDFNRDFDRRVSDLETATSAGRVEDVARAAHALKGLFLDLGMARMARDATDIEDAARAGRAIRFDAARFRHSAATAREALTQRLRPESAH